LLVDFYASTTRIETGAMIVGVLKKVSGVLLDIRIALNLVQHFAAPLWLGESRLDRHCSYRDHSATMGHHGRALTSEGDGHAENGYHVGGSSYCDIP
jgi:hypothetical protein